MRDKATVRNATAWGLREVLLDYLQGSCSVAAWPGGDGLTLEDILDFYPKAVVRGKVPDWQQLLRRHPELEAELHSWLAAKDRWQFAYHRHAASTITPAMKCSE